METPSRHVTTSGVPLVRIHEDFESFFRREYRPVLGLAIVLTGSAAVAEELVQDAFMAALRDWPRVGAYERPDAWVRRVVSNSAVSRFRRTMAEARALVRIGRPRPEVFEVDDAMAVWSEVRRLSARQAQVIALTYLHDLSRAEVAEVLDCSEETVKTHLARARAILAKRLGTDEGGAL